MKFFPLFYDLDDKPVVLAGGGDVAARKVEPLIKCGANVTIVSPLLEESLKKRADSGEVEWISDTYNPEYLQGAVQVWATTNHKIVERTS